MNNYLADNLISKIIKMEFVRQKDISHQWEDIDSLIDMGFIVDPKKYFMTHSKKNVFTHLTKYIRSIRS